MEFKIEVSDYETIFSSFEVFHNIQENRLVFNLLNLNEREYGVFCQSNNKEIFLDEKNGIISFRCVVEKIQFALLIDESQRNYFHHYFDNHGEIGFSAKNTQGQQHNKATIFQK